MTHNRIERLERDLVARRRRRGRRGAISARPGIAADCSSRAFNTDDGGAINMLCDRPTPEISAGASYVNAFEAVEAVDIVAAVDVDDRPSIADPTTAGSVDPTTSVDPTITGGTADPTIAVAPGGDPTIEPPSPNPVAPPPAPPPRETAPDDLGGWQVTSDAPDQETAFAQDIAAILAHASGDDTVPTQAPTPTPSAQPQAPAATAPQMGVGATSGHDIFDRMAAANRYDQGPIALSVDFTAMDRAIDRGQPTAPLPPPAAPADAATQPPPPPSVDVADVAAIDAITAASGPFRVTTDVPLVAQVPGLSCHAAACASIVAWRDDVKPVPAEVSAATGYWERFAEGRTAVYPDVLDAFGLTHSVVGPAPSATALKDLIERAGPLWVAASPPGERAVVVSGVTGDGTSSGTMVDVVDPWARSMTTFGSPNPGSIYHQSLAELLTGIAGGAGGAGNPVVIAQLKEGRS